MKELSKTKKRYFPLFVVSLLSTTNVLTFGSFKCLYILLCFTSRHGTARMYCVFSFYSHETVVHGYWKISVINNTALTKSNMSLI